MSKQKNNLFLFDQPDEDGYNNLNVKHVNKNMVTFDEDDFQISKPKLPAKKEQELIWEPGRAANRKKKALPALQKNTKQIRKEIVLQEQREPQQRLPVRQIIKPKEQYQLEQITLVSNVSNKQKIPLRKPEQKVEQGYLFDEPEEESKQKSVEENNIFDKNEKLKQEQQRPEESIEQPEETIVDQSPISIQLTHITSLNITDRSIFVVSPIPKGKVVQCTIKRDKSWLNMLYPHYDVYLSEGFKYLMSAKKRAGNTTSNYLMTTNKNQMEITSPSYIGKVRSNFVGTEFNVYDHGANPEKVDQTRKPRKTLANIHYKSNFFGTKGPRAMQVYIPNVDNPSKAHHFPRQLKQLYATNNQLVTFMKNKTPKFNSQLGVFVLNFFGRVDKPSVKNFLLEPGEGDVGEQEYHLLFGRIGEDVFNLDVRYPLSPLQGLGIVLSSFDNKLACE